jgi:hypothetical protein
VLADLMSAPAATLQRHTRVVSLRRPCGPRPGDRLGLLDKPTLETEARGAAPRPQLLAVVVGLRKGCYA